MPAKTKKRTPPAGQGALVPVQLRLEPELVDRVNEKIAEVNSQRVLKLTRTDVFRLLLHGWLEGDVELET
jgi:hypothetical protein